MTGEILARSYGPEITAYSWEGGWYANLSRSAIARHRHDVQFDGWQVVKVGPLPVIDVGVMGPFEHGRIVAKHPLAAFVWKANEWLWSAECWLFDKIAPDNYPECEDFSYKKLAIALIKKVC